MTRPPWAGPDQAANTARVIASAAVTIDAIKAFRSSIRNIAMRDAVVPENFITQYLKEKHHVKN